MYIDNVREYLENSHIKISDYAELYMQNNKIALDRDLNEKLEPEFLLDNTYQGLQVGKVYRNLDREYLEYWMAVNTDRIKVFTDRRDAWGNVIGYSVIQKIFVPDDKYSDKVMRMAEAKNFTYGWCSEVGYKYHFNLTIIDKNNPYIKKVYTDINNIISIYLQSKMKEPLHIEGIGILYKDMNDILQFQTVNAYPFDVNQCI